MMNFLAKSILVLLVFFVGAFSMNDYLHASHSDKFIEEAACQCNPFENNQDSNCDCLCVCDISPLNMEFRYNFQIDYTSTYISIQNELLPPTPFLNPLERPPQAV